MDVGSGVLSAAVLLFFVMDPFGNVPLALSLLKDVAPKRRRKVMLRELLIALGVLTFFLFLGQSILDFLGLHQESVSIAGGIVLLIIGLRMIFPKPEGVMGQQVDGEPFIVPLAVPLIAGPSAMAMVILLAKGDPGAMGKWLAALLIAWVGAAAVMLASPLLMRVLGARGLSAMERLMGMLLIMLAVEMVIGGLITLL
ncbi:MAG: MarC family protein [Trueperaceae bacterium]